MVLYGVFDTFSVQKMLSGCLFEYGDVLTFSV